MRSIVGAFLLPLLATAPAARASNDQGYNHENVDDAASFGQHDNLWGSSQDHGSIPGWHLLGHQGFTPEVLSDRIILTPPYPGNRRGAIWTDRSESSNEWMAEFEFRATGQERGSGNLQLWYAKDGQQVVGTSSIYTVGKFDGLALVVSQYGARGGSIRGFLNDGQTNYKDHHNVDRLSFGQCDFSYRNLGRFAHISMKQTRDAFEVEIDKKPCFKTHKVKLPSGYFFGITAASAENPDSFETKSFITTKINQAKGEHDHHSSHHDGSQQQNGKKDGPGSQHTPNDGSWYWITEEKKSLRDAPADSFQTDAQRFEDIHDRLSIIGTALDILFNDLTTFKVQTEKRHEELLHRLDDMHAWLTPTHDHVEASRRELEDLREQAKIIRNDVESKDYREHLEQLHQLLKQSHMAVMSSVPQALHHVVQSANPRFGFFAFLIIASQVALFASYVVYRRRKDAQPKKYL